jgi:hypothetical protein
MSAQSLDTAVQVWFDIAEMELRLARRKDDLASYLRKLSTDELNEYMKRTTEPS